MSGLATGRPHMSRWSGFERRGAARSSSRCCRMRYIIDRRSRPARRGRRRPPCMGTSGLYAHPSVTAVVAGDAALLPSFRALQVRARPNATQHPPVVFASYRTDVDSESLVGGADAHKHVASYSSRKDVLVVLGPGRGHRRVLSHLLGRWRGRRLVVTGHDELREAVEEHCASERGIAAASAPDKPEPAPLAALAGGARGADAAADARGVFRFLCFVAAGGAGGALAVTNCERLWLNLCGRHVVIAPAGSTGCFLALEHGLPVAAPLNSHVRRPRGDHVEIKILRRVRGVDLHAIDMTPARAPDSLVDFHTGGHDGQRSDSFVFSTRILRRPSRRPCPTTRRRGASRARCFRCALKLASSTDRLARRDAARITEGFERRRRHGAATEPGRRRSTPPLYASLLTRSGRRSSWTVAITPRLSYDDATFRPDDDEVEGPEQVQHDDVVVQAPRGAPSAGGSRRRASICMPCALARVRSRSSLAPLPGGSPSRA